MEELKGRWQRSESMNARLRAANEELKRAVGKMRDAIGEAKAEVERVLREAAEAQRAGQVQAVQGERWEWWVVLCCRAGGIG